MIGARQLVTPHILDKKTLTIIMTLDYGVGIITITSIAIAFAIITSEVIKACPRAGAFVERLVSET